VNYCDGFNRSHLLRFNSRWRDEPESKSAVSHACKDQVSPFVSCVGLFLNAAEVDVHQALSLMPTLVPQFHGQESAEYCDRFDRPYLKAIGVGGSMPADSDLAKFTRCGGFLFDSNVPGELGGTGHTFDWSKLSKNMPDSLILAGCS